MQAASKPLTASAVVMVAAVATLAAGCSSGTRHDHVATSSDPPLLELTGRVGDITLGEPKTTVESEYGTEGNGFHVTYRNAGAISGYYRLHHGRVLVVFDGERVSELDLRTPYYRTKDGVGIGSRIPLGPCSKTATKPCEHRWHGFLCDAWVRETPCNCWVKVGRRAQSLPATTKNFMKPWFFITSSTAASRVSCSPGSSWTDLARSRGSGPRSSELNGASVVQTRRSPGWKSFALADGRTRRADAATKLASKVLTTPFIRRSAARRSLRPISRARAAVGFPGPRFR
jgi:hypothetical protein